MTRFNVGDKVVVKSSNPSFMCPNGSKGVIVKMNHKGMLVDKLIVVDFGKDFDGHDGGLLDAPPTHWWLEAKDLRHDNVESEETK